MQFLQSWLLKFFVLAVSIPQIRKIRPSPGRSISVYLYYSADYLRVKRRQLIVSKMASGRQKYRLISRKMQKRPSQRALFEIALVGVGVAINVVVAMSTIMRGVIEVFGGTGIEPNFNSAVMKT